MYAAKQREVDAGHQSEKEDEWHHRYLQGLSVFVQAADRSSIAVRTYTCARRRTMTYVRRSSGSRT